VGETFARRGCCLKCRRAGGVQQAIHLSDRESRGHVALVVKKNDGHLGERRLRCNLFEKRAIALHFFRAAVGNKQNRIHFGKQTRPMCPIRAASAQREKFRKRAIFVFLDDINGREIEAHDLVIPNRTDTQFTTLRRLQSGVQLPEHRSLSRVSGAGDDKTKKDFADGVIKCGHTMRERGRKE